MIYLNDSSQECRSGFCGVNKQLCNSNTQTLKHPNTQTLLRHVANHEVVEYHTIGAIQPHSGLRLRSNRSTPDTIGGYSS